MDRREPSTRGYSTCECERQTWNQIPPLQGVVSEEVNFERASLNVAPKYTWHSTNVRLDFLENGASRGKISPHVSCTFSHVEQPTVDRSFPSRSELAGIQVRPINFQTRSSRKRRLRRQNFIHSCRRVELPSSFQLDSPRVAKLEGQILSEYVRDRSARILQA